MADTQKSQNDLQDQDMPQDQEKGGEATATEEDLTTTDEDLTGLTEESGDETTGLSEDTSDDTSSF